MMEGLQLRDKRDRDRQAETLHLQRMLIAIVGNYVRSFDKVSKNLDVLDIWTIPEIDEHIKKARKREKIEMDKRLQRVREKFPTHIK